MRLNKSTGYAIRILIDCARAKGALVKVADLSARLDITMQNVFKIVHILSRAELVAAVRGRYGGVRLARPADKIRIGDVVRAIETTQFEIDADATDRTQAPDTGAAGVNRVLDDALDAFIGVLDQHTLADMARERGARGPSLRVPVRARARAKLKPALVAAAARRNVRPTTRR